MSRRSPRAGGGATAAALLSVLLAPWALRTLTLLEERASPAVADLRGYLADLAVSLLVLALAAGLARFARWLAALLAGFTALVHHANYETLVALGALASAHDLPYLFDRTFFLGSATAVAHPWLLGTLLVLSAGLAFVFAGRLWPRGAAAAAVCGALLLGVPALWKQDLAVDGWRQVDVVEQNLRTLLAGDSPAPGGDFLDPPTAMLDLMPELRADLSGEPRFPAASPARNVLLLVLEGVSGNYLPGVAADHGTEPWARMDRLDAIFRGNVGYSTFFTHQRKTNRGLYALLCGELPALVGWTAKMGVFASQPWRVCLPELLRREGYETVYLQAAPLAFMLKDRFMPRAGFERVVGHEWFERYYARTKWGVDDKAFYEQAIDMVRELHGSRKPFFLTLLTVGSHHPYVVPKEFRGRYDRRDRRRAFDYLDLAIGEFVERLEQEGVLEDTLVLLVSDESAGGFAARADTGGRLTQNWGFLIAMLPDRARARVLEPFAQMDVPLSILDQLGLAEAGGHLFGRSVFRRYSEGRYLFFANINHRTLSALDPSGRILHCLLAAELCGVYDGRDGRIFAEPPPLPDDPEFRELALEMAARSQPPRQDRPLEIPLVAQPVFVVDSRRPQVVHGGQHVSPQAGDWIEVEFEVEAVGRGQVLLEHFIRLPGSRDVLSANAHMEGGQTLRVHYTFASEHPLPNVDCRSTATLERGWKVELVFKKGRFVLHRSGQPPVLGVQMAQLELDPPSDDPAAVGAVIQEPAFYRDLPEGVLRSGEAGGELNED